MPSETNPDDHTHRHSNREGKRTTALLFERLIVPVASEADTASTCRAMTPYLSDVTERLVVVHVIETRSTFMDKAPLAARREQADRLFDIAEEQLGTAPGFETRLRYGSDVVEEILETVSEIDATAILFTPRRTNRLTRLLSGDEEHRLVTESPCPVVAIPEADSGVRREVRG